MRLIRERDVLDVIMLTSLQVLQVKKNIQEQKSWDVSLLKLIYSGKLTFDKISGSAADGLSCDRRLF